jgi:hypothetical protein
MDDNGEDEGVARSRERSRRSVQALFGLVGLMFVIAGLVAHHAPLAFGPQSELLALAGAFLFIGASYTATMLAWDRIF